MILLVAGTACIGLAATLLAIAGESYFARGMAYVEDDLRDKLRRLRVNTRPLHRWVVAWVIAVFGGLLGFTIAAGSLPFGIVFAVTLVCVPWYLVRRTAERRRLRIEDQLADAMVSLASAIKAGLSLGQALEILAQQCPRPICEEFRQMYGEYQMGKPLERVLVETRDRLKSENFALFAAAMQASRESGGRLNETVERIAHSVMELQRLERKIVSETAQARTSALYMALAPFAVLVMYYFFIDPENTERLFVTVPGQLILCASLAFNLVAYVWARRILNADI
ncbi:MAG TPA: type II secretion system F family protein [Planctomycetaceae bacterium]|nr:type II secretion system F family protein [Planctomycetaceae bacterium]